jgi:hypothetical protein
MDIKIIKVESLGKYKIYALFNDGTEGVYDIGHLSGKGIFKFWKKGDNFSKVFINPENNAIAWSESLGIDTLNCYLKLKGIDFNTFKSITETEKYALG